MSLRERTHEGREVLEHAGLSDMDKDRGAFARFDRYTMGLEAGIKVRGDENTSARFTLIPTDFTRAPDAPLASEDTDVDVGDGMKVRLNEQPLTGAFDGVESIASLYQIPIGMVPQGGGPQPIKTFKVAGAENLQLIVQHKPTRDQIPEGMTINFHPDVEGSLVIRLKHHLHNITYRDGTTTKAMAGKLAHLPAPPVDCCDEFGNVIITLQGWWVVRETDGNTFAAKMVNTDSIPGGTSFLRTAATIGFIGVGATPGTVGSSRTFLMGIGATGAYANGLGDVTINTLNIHHPAAQAAGNLRYSIHTPVVDVDGADYFTGAQTADTAVTANAWNAKAPLTSDLPMSDAQEFWICYQDGINTYFSHDIGAPTSPRFSSTFIFGDLTASNFTASSESYNRSDFSAYLDVTEAAGGIIPQVIHHLNQMRRN